VLATVGARTSAGKSVFLGQAALKCAHQDHKPALFFSLEMSQTEMYRRWAANLSQKPYGSHDRREIGSALLRVNQLASDGLLQVFTGPRTVEQIESEAMAYAARQPLGLIAVDYIQAISPTHSRSEGREQQVAHIAAALKRLAMKSGVPVLTASQLNKAGEESPRSSTLRESEAIGNYSNVVILLKSMGDKFASSCEMDLIVDKNRDGSCGIGGAIWCRPIFTIRDPGI
jgi:replicative DNA helicase